jgi:hypothetical protein
MPMRLRADIAPEPVLFSFQPVYDYHQIPFRWLYRHMIGGSMKLLAQELEEPSKPHASCTADPVMRCAQGATAQ